MHPALKPFFEEQIRFRLEDGTSLDGSVYIGETEFLPVELLREDPDAYRSEFDRWFDEQWTAVQSDRRKEILQLFGNAGRYADLCEALQRAQVVPLVGSGMSVPTGLPTWGGLLERICGYTHLNPADLKRLTDAGQYEEAVDLLVEGTNRNLFLERVEHELRVNGRERIDGAIRLLPAIFSGTVITTNLDDVLEAEYARCDLQFTRVLAGREIANLRRMRTPGERCLLKVHGDCRLADSQVLSSAEYDAAYGVDGVNRMELELLCRTNSVLFLGCSLRSDRTVRLMEEIARLDGNTPKHFAILELPPTGEERIAREDFLTERRIYPIWYNQPHDSSMIALLSGLLDVLQ